MQSNKNKICLEWSVNPKNGNMSAKLGMFTYKLIRDDDHGVETFCELPLGTRMLYRPTRNFDPSWSFAESVSGDIETSERPHIFTHWGQIQGVSVLWVVPMQTIRIEWNGDKEKAKEYYNAVTTEINMICDGDVWRIKVFFGGEEVDACWGFVGEQWAKEAVVSQYVGCTYKAEIEKILAEKVADIENIHNYLNTL